MVLPPTSVILMIVLLKLAVMCACPWLMFFRSRRRTRFGCCSSANFKLLLRDLLLAGNCHPATFARPGIRMGALPPHRKPAPVAYALIGTDLHLPFDVLGNITTKVTLYLEVLVLLIIDAVLIVAGFYLFNWMEEKTKKSGSISHH